MKFDISEYLDELRPLVNIDCGTYNITGIERVTQLVQQKFENIGWQVRRYGCGKAGPGLVISNQVNNGPIDLLILGHVDTSYSEGTAFRRPMSIAGEFAYGPGIADSKAGLVNLLHALRSTDPSDLAELSIAILICPDKHVSSRYSHTMLNKLAKRAKRCMVLDTGTMGGCLINGRRGMARYQVDFTGQSAHAAKVGKRKCSAISEMGQWVVKLEQLAQQWPNIDVNVGYVAGGEKTNQVAEHCQMKFELRFTSNHYYQQLDQQLRQWSQSPSVEQMHIVLDRKAYKPAFNNASNQSFCEELEQAAENLGQTTKWRSGDKSSNANLVAAHGLACVDGLGAVGQNLNSPEECIAIERVLPRIQLLRACIKHLANAEVPEQEAETA
ncbi:M20/M25/M40 family metallo-hydrolase [Aliagarivorans marinus]|uniref:M20/M25/M40 family metallo-hydrolase n=1 Tax=Aliagarivorans marinus TaxID=561965 RepID=UPI0003F6F644|nr:M20/M25/M40 family metallo-hydrolase [Aliagarivorans marinus]